MSFNRNLLIGSGLSIILLLLSSIASLVSINEFKDSTKWVNHTEEVIRNLQSATSQLKDAETTQRGYLLTGNERFIEAYRSAVISAPSFIRKVKELTVDNPPQQLTSDEAMAAIQHRVAQLDSVIARKQRTGTVNPADLETGRVTSLAVFGLVQTMQSREEVLLVQRNARLSSYGKLTPIIIILTALLAIGISIFFYTRVRKDYETRTALQKNLEEKDRDISRRIGIIEQVAGKISDGDYSVRTPDEGDDGLGSLSESLNKMAESLNEAFTKLANDEWLQKGIRELAESLLGVQDMQVLSKNILNVTTGYTGSQMGAIYILQDDGRLHLSASQAVPGERLRKIYEKGEGLAGQCYDNRSIVAANNIDNENWRLPTLGGDATPKNIVAIPMLHEGEVKGVIELATLHHYQPRARKFFESISAQTGILINAVQSNLRVRELLQESQAQSEELQAQHSELENINTELEAQSQKLQASEEELRVQQEELMQANQELEERAHLLEERNEQIATRTRDLAEKAEQLEQSTKYKSEFLANMSHELRTPLNSILLLSRLMSDNDSGNLSKDQVEYANVIQSAGKGLLSLIDEILDLSKIEAGKMLLDWEEVPLAEIAGNMEDLFLQVAKEKGLALNISIAEDLPDTIETDEQRVEQILKNLLSNALKFTANGSVSLKIEKASDTDIRFTVADTGIGIAADKRNVIFEAFQQEDGSTQRRYGGTGLGLAISKELARLLNGHITLESEEGKGSAFILTLPAVRTDTADAPAEDAKKPAYSEQKSPPAIQQAPPVRNIAQPQMPAAIPDDRDSIAAGDKVILIIEDDTAFAKTLLDYTHKRAYKGIVAVSGDEGLALARKYKPAAVMLDIMLPVMDGWQVMHELKTDSTTRHIPVHMMSSHSDARKQSLQEGAVDFVSKPVAPDDITNIFEKLETVLNRESRKVLILEENSKHATALAAYLENFNITPEVAKTPEQSVELLKQQDIDCVILDMGIPDKQAYEVLEMLKKTPGLEQLPVIIYTGKSLSKPEEERIRQYADSIVLKTAHSYQRMLDEVSLFLHLVEQSDETETRRPRRLQGLKDVLLDRTILVADDDVRNIFSLSKALEQHGVKVIAATDGNDALEQLAANPQTDLVLMDMMMPEKDGYDATKAIRSNPQTRNLPVIAVTAKAMTGDRERCMEAGASDYITKPVDIDQLLSLLRVWLYDRIG